jgi:hypothetical protein
MEKSATYPLKPVFLSGVVVLLVSVLLSCLMPAFNGFSIEKVLTENLIKDAGADKEASEEKKFSEDGSNIFCSDGRLIKFRSTVISFSSHKSTLWLPKASLDIPVPPPKNTVS